MIDIFVKFQGEIFPTASTAFLIFAFKREIKSHTLFETHTKGLIYNIASKDIGIEIDENQHHNVKLSFWPFIQILFEKVAAVETESKINTYNFWRKN